MRKTGVENPAEGERSAASGLSVIVGGGTAASLALPLELMPAWLLTDIKEHQRTVCIDQCGVGRELGEVQRVLAGASLVGLDASEEAIVEARRRYPDYRFRVDTADFERAFDVCVQLEATVQRTKLGPALARLASMSRRAVVVTLAEGSIAPGDLPLVIGDGFSLVHAERAGDARQWLVATWVHAEIAALYALPAGESLPALLSRNTESTRARTSQLEAEVARLRTRLAEAQRELVLGRQLVADRTAELEHMAREVAQTRELDAELRQELARMQASRSWQLTRPLRAAVGKSQEIQSQTRDLLALAKKVSSDVVKGRASEWLRLARSQEEGSRERKPPVEVRLDSASTSADAPLFEETVYMFALVPFDDVGGGQRSAQLARVLAARGHRVVYVYLYKKWSIQLGGEEESHVDVPLLTHVHVSQVDPEQLLRSATPGSVAIFEAPHPSYEPFFDRAAQIGLRTVFELIDAWDTSLGGDWFKPELMRRFAGSAELAVGTAKALVTQLERYGRPGAVYLPNAGNEALFDGTRSYARPVEIEPGRKAIVYVGSLYGEWFGWDYVKAAAKLCGSATIYLIGDAPKNLELPPNVRLLGARPIEQVPAYLAHADATIIPFIPGKISDAVSPIKVFEYLLMGKPVISTELPELRGYPNVILADSIEAFARACRDVERPDGTPENFIMRNTWSARADALLSAPHVPPVSVIVRSSGALFESERLASSLSLHGNGPLKEVVWVGPKSDAARAEALRKQLPRLTFVALEGATVGDAWAAARDHVSADIVCFLDESQWCTSRACFEEAARLFATRASLGALGTEAWFLDPDSGHPTPVRPEWLAEHRAAGSVRRDVAFVSPRGLFVRRALLDRLLATPLPADDLQGAELCFRIKAAGLDVAARALTGLRVPPHVDEPLVTSETRADFLGRWAARRNFFVARRGA